MVMNFFTEQMPTSVLEEIIDKAVLPAERGGNLIVNVKEAVDAGLTSELPKIETAGVTFPTYAAGNAVGAWMLNCKFPTQMSDPEKLMPADIL